jgi:hypothetical protein
MEHGSSGLVNPWGLALFRSLQRADPQSPVEQAAFSKWFDQTSDRESARVDRIHGAQGVIPRAVWIALFFMAAVIFVFMMFFADSGEGPVVQGIQVGAVVAVITASMFVIYYLGNPYRPGGGGLQPVAMKRTQAVLETLQSQLPAPIPPPCDAVGRPNAAT